MSETVRIYPTLRDLDEFMAWDMLESVVAPYYNKQQLLDFIESGKFIIQVHYHPEIGVIVGTNVYISRFEWKFELFPKGVKQGEQVLVPFIVSVDHVIDCDSVTKKYVVHNLASTLAEAAASYLTSEVNINSIRPAFGYPMCPIHSYKKDVLDILQVNDIYKLTSTFGIIPETSICGVIISK